MRILLIGSSHCVATIRNANLNDPYIFDEADMSYYALGGANYQDFLPNGGLHHDFLEIVHLFEPNIIIAIIGGNNINHQL